MIEITLKNSSQEQLLTCTSFCCDSSNDVDESSSSVIAVGVYLLALGISLSNAISKHIRLLNIKKSVFPLSSDVKGTTYSAKQVS